MNISDTKLRIRHGRWPHNTRKHPTVQVENHCFAEASSPTDTGGLPFTLQFKSYIWTFSAQIPDRTVEPMCLSKQTQSPYIEKPFSSFYLSVPHTHIYTIYCWWLGRPIFWPENLQFWLCNLQILTLFWPIEFLRLQLQNNSALGVDVNPEAYIHALYVSKF